MKTNKIFKFLLLLTILIISACQKQPEHIYCTQDAMICPDGSYVERYPPICDFAPCPEPEDGGWLTYTDSKTATRFQYPAELKTNYITVTEWPPKIQVSSQSFSCEQPVVMNGMSYCVSTITEGTAGSIYTVYSYSFPKEDQTVTLIFTLQAVQCGNYDEVEKLVCEHEREAFDPSKLVDQIAETLIFIGT